MRDHGINIYIHIYIYIVIHCVDLLPGLYKLGVLPHYARSPQDTSSDSALVRGVPRDARI